MLDASLVPIGPVRMLQIQREQLILGVRPDRTYRTGPLHETDHLVLSGLGVITKIDGAWALDRHHVAHPANGDPAMDRLLSMGFTSHYDAMAQRFGTTPTGVGGENIIVESDTILSLDDVAGGLVIKTAGGDVELNGVAVAAPCVPFTKHLLRDQDAPVDVVQDARQFLHNGTRGYVMGLAGLSKPVEIRNGDIVFRRSIA